MRIVSRKEILLDDITETFMPLRDSEDEEKFRELKMSLRQTGQMHPIIVRQKEDKYELLAGTRRVKAAREAQMTYIDAIVVEADDLEAFRITIEENEHRQPLKPTQVIAAIQHMQQTTGKSLDELLNMLNYAESTRYKFKVVMTSPAEILLALHEDKISFEVAYELTKIPSKFYKLWFLEHAIKDGANAATIRRWAKEYEEEIKQEYAREQGINIQPVKPQPKPIEPSKPTLKEEESKPAQTGYILPETVACWGCKQTVEYTKSKRISLCDSCYNTFIDILKQLG